MPGKKFAQLDAIRFFAILTTGGCHWGLFGDYLPGALDIGFRALDLFLVLSGFLITLRLFDSSDGEHKPLSSLYKFYVKRFLRIFPAYYLALVLFWILGREWIAPSIWWNLSYLTNFYLIKVQNWDGPSHLWSLAVEEQFYLVWPLLILFAPRRFTGWVIVLAIALSIATKIYWRVTESSWWVWYVHPVSSLDSLAIGALLSYLYSYHNELLNKWLNKAKVLGITLAIVAVVTYLKYTALDFVHWVLIRFCFGLFSAVLIGKAVNGYPGITGSILNNARLQYIGKISYAIYLFIPIPWLVEHYLLGGRRLGLVVEIMIVVCAAIISWYFFEKPILKFKERFN